MHTHHRSRTNKALAGHSEFQVSTNAVQQSIDVQDLAIGSGSTNKKSALLHTMSGDALIVRRGQEMYLLPTKYWLSHFKDGQ